MITNVGIAILLQNLVICIIIGIICITQIWRLYKEKVAKRLEAHPEDCECDTCESLRQFMPSMCAYFQVPDPANNVKPGESDTT